MTGRTGYTEITNGDAPDFGPDITSVLEHFDPLIGESAADASSLPASGNWVGRTILVEDIDDLYVCTGLPNSWQRATRSSTSTGTPTMGVSWYAPTLNSVELRSGVVFYRFTGQRSAVIGGGGVIATIPVGFRTNAKVATQSYGSSGSSNPTQVYYDTATHQVKHTQTIPFEGVIDFTLSWPQTS